MSYNNVILIFFVNSNVLMLSHKIYNYLYRNFIVCRMPNNGKKVSSVGITLSKEAYLNIKKIYHFSVFYLPSLEDLSLNDFILLAVIGHLQVAPLEKFEITKYPYSEKTFTAVRVPSETREYIEKLWRKRIKGDKMESKRNLSEIISSVIERMNTDPVWLDSFALLYFISFINDAFKDLLTNEERENFTKKLIIPDFVKTMREPIFSFFSKKYYEHMRDTSNTKIFYEFFKESAEKIATLCNLRSKVIHGSSLTEYTPESILERFHLMRYELYGISIVIGTITETNDKDIQVETKVDEEKSDVDLTIKISSTRKNWGKRRVNIYPFVMELYLGEKTLYKIIELKKGKNIRNESTKTINEKKLNEIDGKTISSYEDLFDEIYSAIRGNEDRKKYLFRYPAYFFETYERMLPVLFDSQLAPKSSQ